MNEDKLIEVRDSPIHGRGVFAIKNIKKGQRIIEYKGRRMTQKESDRVYGGTSDTGHTFLFTVNDYYVIDANVGGSIARWINHGCKPNCESETEEDDSGRPDKEQVFIHAIRDIKAGDELTYDYLITLDEPHTKRMQKIWKCLCGAKKCKGTMLADKED